MRARIPNTTAIPKRIKNPVTPIIPNILTVIHTINPIKTISCIGSAATKRETNHGTPISQNIRIKFKIKRVEEAPNPD